VLNSEFNTLYLEWNALTDVARRQELFVAGIKPNLQHLILRYLFYNIDSAKWEMKS